jgi:Fe-S oxidoreductase
MDTRDRAEEIGRAMDKNGGKWADDGKSLFGDYISAEEIWACNTCNACSEACPVNINPLSIINQLRQFQVLEASANPAQLNGMFTSMENAGTPWALPASDRFNWAGNVSMADEKIKS